MTQQLTGAEFKVKYPDCELVKLVPVTKTLDGYRLNYFATLKDLLLCVASGKFKKDKFRSATLPDDAMVCLETEFANDDDVGFKFVVCSSDRIILGDIVTLDNLFEFNKLSIMDYIFCLTKTNKIMDCVSDPVLKELCTMLISTDGMYLQHVPERLVTVTLCFMAFIQNRKSIQYVPESLRATMIKIFEDLKDFHSANEDPLDESNESNESNEESLERSFDEFKDESAVISDYLELVKDNGLALAEVPVEERTEEICLAAVENNGIAIRYVPVKTEEICLAAVKNNGFAIQYVPVKTEELCIAAVERRGNALEYVPYEYYNDKLCVTAIEGNKNSLKYIPPTMLTNAIIVAAIKEYGFAPERIPEEMITKEIYAEVFKSNHSILKSMPNEMKTDEMCLEAVRADKKMLEFVPEKIRSRFVYKNKCM